MVKYSIAEKLNILFGIIMVLIYFTLGIVIAFVGNILPDVDVSYKTWFGIIIIIYGIYRLYKVYTYYNQIKEDSSGADSDEKI
jgi:hypothetical protein